MKFGWMIVSATANALLLGGCFQSEQPVGPKKNELAIWP